MERGSLTCVTAHGQEFSITLTFGVISVKYSYNHGSARPPPKGGQAPPLKF